MHAHFQHTSTVPLVLQPHPHYTQPAAPSPHPRCVRPVTTVHLRPHSHPPPLTTTPYHLRLEKVERKREAKAQTAAQLERSIESELLKRLQSGTYGDIYNFPLAQYSKVRGGAGRRGMGDRKVVLGKVGQGCVDAMRQRGAVIPHAQPRCAPPSPFT